jgi:predicted nucleic acid-binding Zn ribbon protein
MAEKRSIPDKRAPVPDIAGIGIPAAGRRPADPSGAVAAGSAAGGPRLRPVRRPSDQDPRQAQGPGVTGSAGSGPRGGRARASAEGRGVARRIGNLSFLGPALAPPATPLATCLEALQRDWGRQDHLAALWQAWPRLAGPQLAPHCRPLALRAGVLTVGALPGPWLQALQYNRHQLLGALRGAGFTIRDLRFSQHYPEQPSTPGSQEEADVWARHPSRSDVHGMAVCPVCSRPAPAGEMARWGHCGFCRRADLAEQARGDQAGGVSMPGEPNGDQPLP